MVGFRTPLSTQDVMLRSTNRFSSPNYRTMAILGLDLEKAFDNVIENAFLTRINRHLDGTGAYPPTMVGFRTPLSTQDVMLQLYQPILNDPTTGTMAILGLDLEKAFDNVGHAAILSRINIFSMDERSYSHIRDYLSRRTVTLAVDSMTSDEHALGSAGTPLGR
ncbi:uncharacterized protein LOC125947734 [Dermacentor silvarum]|uniref:uncharacterized protein LOC125947734 n=1 Tax=Dermacentor silvarum TaxID=543639 RepID=UPI002100C576|nr:uncharacterized protein LOC125947734 [Dermacentor silvarum]